MKNQKTSGGYLSKGVLWLMATVSCFVVANNYYNQPLLGEISREFAVSEDDANRVATITILGYAFGLFLLVPLGDMFRKKKIIVFDFILIISSLLCFAFSPNITVMMISGFLIGLSSVVPQMLVPLAAQISRPEKRSKNIGIVMGGLLTGILGSRVIAGIIGEAWGWRTVFFVAAAVMVILWLLVAIFLPDVKPTFKGTYKKLMLSVISLFKKRSDLRIAALRGALSLASFQAFWTTLTFYLEHPPFSAGSDIAGLLSIVGIGGAIAATYIGRIVDKVDKRKVLLMATLLMLVGWVFFNFTSLLYIGLILGIFVLDVGLQSIHITNQSIIFAKDADATNRLNTIYMTCYFAGGSLGAFLGGKAWVLWGWSGVVATGSVFIFVLLFVQLFYRKDV